MKPQILCPFFRITGRPRRRVRHRQAFEIPFWSSLVCAGGGGVTTPPLRPRHALRRGPGRKAMSIVMDPVSVAHGATTTLLYNKLGVCELVRGGQYERLMPGPSHCSRHLQPACPERLPHDYRRLLQCAHRWPFRTPQAAGPLLFFT